MNHYELELENDSLLNISSFVKFCLENQNKDIVLRVINEGHCLRFCGVYDILDMFTFKSVELQTWNILEKHEKYLINTKNWNYWFKNLKDFNLNFDYTWTKEKVFGCFYGRASAPRLGIAGYLSKYYNNKSIIKVKFDFTTEDSRKLFDLQRLFAWHPEAIEYINEFVKYNYSSEEYIKGNWMVNNPLSYLYKDLFIDIVSEPTCKGTTFYPTEKVVRAILCKRPFIAMCSKNYLIYLRQMGFITFYNYWNEDYDGYDGKEKYHRILKLIDYIGKLNINDLNRMYSDMQDILNHNRNLLLTQTYTTKIERIE